MENFLLHPFMMLYGLAWKLALPILKRSKRLSYGWEQRTKLVGWQRTDSKQIDIWLQAASGGEARLALEIFSQFPKDVALNIAFVTWTKQGREIVQHSLDQIKISHPLLSINTYFAPLDDPEIIMQAIKMTRPKLVTLLETELWPGLLSACHNYHIPIIVINGRINNSTYHLGRVFSGFFQKNAPQSILAISQSDADKFKEIFPSEISLMPNIKFDIAAKFSSLKKQAFCFAHSVFLFASVRGSDAHILPAQFPKIFKSVSDAVIIIAPRHLEKVPLWYSLCVDLGLRPLLLSGTPNFEKIPAGSVLIWDRFGDLSSLYSCASAVYVGGAYKEGGQNFLETLAEGKIPCVGKNPSNFHWALSKEISPSLEEENLIAIASSSRTIAEKMLSLYFNKEKEERVKKRFGQWLQRHLGGTQIAVRNMLTTMNDGQFKKRGN